MRQRFQLSVLAVVVAAVTLASFAGCWPFTEGADCATAFIGCPAIDSGPPSTCIPSQNGTPVADACGVFVSSSMGSDTTGTGTKGAPYQTLAHALASSKGQPVYACGETFMVTQSVMVSTKVDLYGALDCAKGWGYDGTNKTQIQADATMTPIPLTLASGASGSSVHDFVITAADATAAGSSSIAVLDDHADLALENVDVAAGAGKDGATGAMQSQVMTPPTANGSAGTSDMMCNVPLALLGGPGGTNTCNGTKTDGGQGGKGYADVAGGQGGDGQPVIASGNGGSAQTKTMACNANDPKGAAGNVGSSGTGARGIGDITASGYAGPVGLAGGSGSPGQGGGGGGGGYACDMPTNMFAGPSGGGGGAGGCGGNPGNPGTSGGSSIGIVALSASLTLTNVTITSRSGGAGALGGNGQLGGNGGQQGNQGASGACPGGLGGQGGPGGPGGGGAGGHSIGIAIKGGTAPDLSTATITPGTAGMGGGGGDMDMTAMTKGDAGKACHVLDFTKQACSTM